MARQEGAYKLGKGLIQGLANLIEKDQLDTEVVDEHGAFHWETTDRNTVLIAGVLAEALRDAGFLVTHSAVRQGMKTYGGTQ